MYNKCVEMDYMHKTVVWHGLKLTFVPSANVIVMDGGWSMTYDIYEMTVMDSGWSMIVTVMVCTQT